MHLRNSPRASRAVISVVISKCDGVRIIHQRYPVHVRIPIDPAIVGVVSSSHDHIPSIPCEVHSGVTQANNTVLRSFADQASTCNPGGSSCWGWLGSLRPHRWCEYIHNLPTSTPLRRNSCHSRSGPIHSRLVA